MQYMVFFTFAVIIFFMTPVLQAQHEDTEGWKDHPLFKRKEGYIIKKCIIKESDTIMFPVGNSISEASKKQAVDGKSYFYFNTLNEGAPKIYPLLIFRNFEDSLRENGGYIAARVVDAANPDSYITGKIEKENMTIWVLIRVYGSDYVLTIVEKQRKIQVIMADEIWNTLEQKDTITIDVFFEDDTTIIIPVSYPVIDQVVEMLVSYPSVNLSIQAHTDNTRDPTSNKVLTAMRAKVVLDALTAKGIEKTRLKSLGWGSDKPVGDNKTEEGRTMNRRLVLVRLTK